MNFTNIQPLFLEHNMQILILIAMILCVQGCTNFRRIYDDERQASLAQQTPLKNAPVLTEADIAQLPEPVQSYIRLCGHLGQPRYLSADIIWANSHYRGKPDAKWIKMKTRQFNSVRPPVRLAHMKAWMMGIIPFEGRDKYADGAGHMYAKLAGLIKIFDTKDPEIGHSALITHFAEALFLPEIALQDYISWLDSGQDYAIAEINHQGIKAQGIFRFDAAGMLIRFESSDRYCSMPDGSYQKQPFYCEVLSHIKVGERIIPQKVTANWTMDGKEFQYWKGTIKEIKYNN